MARVKYTEDVNVVLKVTGDRIDDIMKALTIELQAELFKETPKDTGHARANWIARIGEAGGTAHGSKSSPNESKSRASAIAVAAKYTFRRYDQITISNHVDYIAELNAGYSPKAAPAFIQTSVYRVAKKVAAAFKSSSRGTK